MPAQRLLVHEVKQGRGHLREFPEVEGPQEPFPRFNERERFPKLMCRAILSSEFALGVGKVVVVASALLLGLWVLRRALRP